MLNEKHLLSYLLILLPRRLVTGPRCNPTLGRVAQLVISFIIISIFSAVQRGNPVGKCRISSRGLVTHVQVPNSGPLGYMY